MAELEICRRTPADALRAAAKELGEHPERYTVPAVSLLLYMLAEIIDEPTLIACGRVGMVCEPAAPPPDPKPGA